MNQTIKAIETRYKGYRFRSRLEARWAVFFDTIGEPWEYEKEGYDLGGAHYLPDFYLPRLNCFIEIKGQEPTRVECLKAFVLRNQGESSVALFYGLPLSTNGYLYCWDVSDSGGGQFDAPVHIGHGPDGKMAFGIRDIGDRVLYSDSGMSKPLPFINLVFSTSQFMHAKEQAQSARFEFGEQG